MQVGQSLQDIVSEHLMLFLELADSAENGEGDHLFVTEDYIFSVVAFDFVGRADHTLMS